MAFLFRAHDPALISAARLETIHAKLWMAVETTPQEAAPQEAAPHFAWTQTMPLTRFVAVGFSVLMLGLFVGHEMDLGIGSEAAVVRRAEQKVSVLAMAEPWESFIVGEE